MRAGTLTAAGGCTHRGRARPNNGNTCCSDGLYGPLGDDGMARVLSQAQPDGPLEATAAALVNATNDAGEPDNVTAILVRCRPGNQSGQAITEYVLTSGMLVLIAIALSGIVTRALKVFVEAVMWELRFLSP